MLPTEQFSGDATEDKSQWTPQVWRKGPDALVADAQLALWQNRRDVEVGALNGSTDAPSFDGTSNQANEWEQVIDPSAPPEGSGGRAAIWQHTLMQMRAVDEWGGQVKSVDYDPSPGDANPPA